MKKLFILIVLLLVSCGGPVVDDNPTGRGEVYQLTCYSYGEKIYDGQVIDFYNDASGWYKYEDNAVGNQIHVSGDCVRERVKTVEVK